MFGEPDENDETKKVNAFEAVLEGNEVRIIMPTALYSTCRNMANALEFQPYLIEGGLKGKDDNGQPIIINPIIVEKLRFDKEKEVYICDSIKPEIKPEEDEELMNILNNEDLPGSPRRELTFWEQFKASMRI